MGIYTLSWIQGAHLCATAGGFIAQSLGWRWCFWIPAMMQGFLWLLITFTLPETLYNRTNSSSTSTTSGNIPFHIASFFPMGKIIAQRLTLKTFLRPLVLLSNPAILLPVLYYATTNTYGTAIYAVSNAHLAQTFFHFSPSITGVYMGIPLTIGCCIGEALTGWVSDFLLNAYAKRHAGYRKPEVRLWLLPLCSAVCFGTGTYGFCLERRGWVDAAVSMGFAGLGTQVATTVVYTYVTDSYRDFAAECAAVIKFCTCSEFCFF